MPSLDREDLPDKAYNLVSLNHSYRTCPAMRASSLLSRREKSLNQFLKPYEGFVLSSSIYKHIDRYCMSIDRYVHFLVSCCILYINAFAPHKLPFRAAGSAALLRRRAPLRSACARAQDWDCDLGGGAEQAQGSSGLGFRILHCKFFLQSNVIVFRKRRGLKALQSMESMVWSAACVNTYKAETIPQFEFRA